MEHPSDGHPTVEPPLKSGLHLRVSFACIDQAGGRLRIVASTEHHDCSACLPYISSPSSGKGESMKVMAAPRCLTICIDGVSSFRTRSWLHMHKTRAAGIECKHLHSFNRGEDMKKGSKERKEKPRGCGSLDDGCRPVMLCQYRRPSQFLPYLHSQPRLWNLKPRAVWIAKRARAGAGAELPEASVKRGSREHPLTIVKNGRH